MRTLTGDFATASARLFAWLARHGEWERLRNFPVFAREGESESVVVIYTPRTPGDGEPAARAGHDVA